MRRQEREGFSLVRLTPSWTVAEYQECYRQLFDVRQFWKMISYGRNAELLDRRYVRREKYRGMESSLIVVTLMVRRVV